MIASTDSDILEAYAVLQEISEDEETRMRYDLAMKNEWAYQSRERYVRKQGEMKGKLEVARNLLQQGIDLAIIQQATGLSLKEIQGIQ